MVKRKSNGTGKFAKGASKSLFAGLPNAADLLEQGEGAGGEDEGSDQPELVNLKEHMAPIKYHATPADKFRSWKPVNFDSKTLGTKCDFTGVLSIECIDGDGDEAEEFLRSLGKGESADGNETTKKKKKKKQKKKENSTDAGYEQKSAVQVEDSTAIKKKKEKQEKVPKQEQDMAGGNKKGVKSGGADGQGVKDHNARKRARMEADETGELAPGATGKVDCSDRPKKKNKTQKERKEERRLRIEKQAQKTAAAAAARSPEIAGEEELGSDNEEDGDTRTPAARDADYDDAFEYEEWGGVQLRKCLTKALLAKGFATATPIQVADCLLKSMCVIQPYIGTDESRACRRQFCQQRSRSVATSSAQQKQAQARRSRLRSVCSSASAKAFADAQARWFSLGYRFSLVSVGI